MTTGVPKVRRTQRERRESTRARIVAATITGIGDRGYQATTTRAVAELAGVSPGTLAHHFPTRIDLIANALDEVGQRLADDFQTRFDELPEHLTDRIGAILDILWGGFRSGLFEIWLKVWFAASEDIDLYRALAPLEPRLSAAIAATVRTVAPDTLPLMAWNSRISITLHAMRGLALSLALEPRPSPTDHDERWPAARAELTALLNRPHSRESGFSSG
ncbi:TetR/AcrR family transcriptional regulator [Pseudonocardia spinosispora]|uniref:TetR/AcrR family transcriptional regulator n=1 Tax=Pseudonocardia spinosispora TaxID=103441 RepID=UPI000422AAB9|nr:TetR/AcrR family transcriptional regulator [Pseudonocardia spinosispora]